MEFITKTVVAPITLGSRDFNALPHKPALQLPVIAAETVPLIKPSLELVSALNPRTLNYSSSISPFSIK